MPIIKITQEAIDKGKPASDGWHLFEIDAFSESDSAKKDSKNWKFDLRCVDEGEDKGRYVFARFNSKAPQILVTSGFLPGAMDTPIDKEIEFNPDDLVKKQLYANVKTEIYEGKPQKKVEEFTSAARPPF